MILKVKANKAEFAQARAGGEVYGELLERRSEDGPYQIYVELGNEAPYEPREQDDPKAQYKFFINCYIEIYKSKRALDEGRALATESRDSSHFVLLRGD